MREAVGLVSDVQRFSLHDGPGVRTTVFLKGCPLDCRWCHNPETIRAHAELSFDAERCVDCEDCVPRCPRAAQLPHYGAERHRLDRTRCDACGECVASCGHGALKLIGRKRTVRDILAEVLRDRAYYHDSGGGVTLSGGEPMQQFRFSLQLLQEARREGIHTCLDTCGFAKARLFKLIAPFVDRFLFDYKATGRARHRNLTGRDPDLIVDNLRGLCDAGRTVTLRCPLVPGVNDQLEHLEAIARWARRYPNLSVELMPFHRMGASKALHVGQKARLQASPPDTATENRWLDELHRLGAGRVACG